MEMKRINAGKLRAIGYDPKTRTLRVELDTGTTLEYSGIGDEIWRRLSTSGAAWSYYRDSIEEEYPCKQVSGVPKAGGNPLDELFKK